MRVWFTPVTKDRKQCRSLSSVGVEQAQSQGCFSEIEQREQRQKKDIEDSRFSTNHLGFEVSGFSNLLQYDVSCWRAGGERKKKVPMEVLLLKILGNKCVLRTLYYKISQSHAM